MRRGRQSAMAIVAVIARDFSPIHSTHDVYQPFLGTNEYASGIPDGVEEMVTLFYVTSGAYIYVNSES